ncbi:hypothetical protein LSH36_877g00012 [Paralvinella palmiformis]|uniref:Uncharacterized protein n=1 Tax=Paralvinella palmiformis TaxID=53620 RepID=A0AAD9IY33_9ANNE|nr:hypothetical protein LSH36_877g00012 [Paralvinella palmiformis]
MTTSQTELPVERSK